MHGVATQVYAYLLSQVSVRFAPRSLHQPSQFRTGESGEENAGRPDQDAPPLLLSTHAAPRLRHSLRVGIDDAADGAVVGRLGAALVGLAAGIAREGQLAQRFEQVLVAV